MILYALDNEEPPLNTRWLAIGAWKRTSSIQTIHTSLSSKCNGRPEAAAATTRASRRSSGGNWRKRSAIVRQRADLLGHPSRKSSTRADERSQLRWRQLPPKRSECFRGPLGSQPCESSNCCACGTSGQDQLPRRNVPKLNHLGAELEATAPPGCQIHLTDGNLSC